MPAEGGMSSPTTGRTGGDCIAGFDKVASGWCGAVSGSEKFIRVSMNGSGIVAVRQLKLTSFTTPRCGTDR